MSLQLLLLFALGLGFLLLCQFPFLAELFGFFLLLLPFGFLLGGKLFFLPGLLFFLFSALGLGFLLLLQIRCLLFSELLLLLRLAQTLLLCLSFLLLLPLQGFTFFPFLLQSLLFLQSLLLSFLFQSLQALFFCDALFFFFQKTESFSLCLFSCLLSGKLFCLGSCLGFLSKPLKLLLSCQLFCLGLCLGLRSEPLLFLPLQKLCLSLGFRFLSLFLSDPTALCLLRLQNGETGGLDGFPAFSLRVNGTVDDCKDLSLLLLSFLGGLHYLLVEDLLNHIDVKGQVIQNIHKGALDDLGRNDLSLLLGLVLPFATDMVLQERVIQYHCGIEVGKVQIIGDLIGFCDFNIEAGLSVGLDEVPQSLGFLEIRVLLQYIGSHNGRANQRGAVKGLDKGGILEVVEDLLDSLDSLEFAKLLGIHIQQIAIHLKARGVNGHLKRALDILPADGEIVPEQDGGHVVAIHAIVDGLQPLTDEILQIDEQGIDEAVLVGFEAFFLEDVQDPVGSHRIIFYLCDHVGMLCQMADGFGRDLSCQLDVNDLFLLDDEASGISNDIVQGDDGILNGFDPSNIDLLIHEAVHKGHLRVAALGFVHKLCVKILIPDKRDKVLSIYIV